MMGAGDDRWVAGEAYDAYMGRWSRRLARAFVEWLQPVPSASWLEVGCGTGALTSAIRDLGEPGSVVACDPSEPFIAYARRSHPDPRISFVQAGAEALPSRVGGFDLAVSGLVLNFLPEPGAFLASVRQRLRAGGTVAAYLWDYAGGMAFLRVFWDEAVALDPAAAALDEGTRFPLCAPQALTDLFQGAGLTGIETGALEIPTEFSTFDDYWTPFLLGTGPAPGYVASLAPLDRERLRERLALRLESGGRGPIALRARAWVVRGISS